MASHPAGRPVVVLRHPSRAVRIADALRSAGLTPYAMPLTDTELSEDTSGVVEGLKGLGLGRFAWLVVTSGNTVRALGMLAAAEGTTLSALVSAGGTRVAAVGQATAGLLAAAGVEVDLVPAHASTAGLLASFDRGSGAVLLPQADLAPDDLRSGLAGLGWSVRRVEVYRTVAYPAEPGRSVPGVEEDGRAPALLTPRELEALLAEGVHPAVVFTAPSTVRRFHERLGDGSAGFEPVAIGPTTAEALRAHGWEPAATAADPTPGAMVRAVEQAFSRGAGHPVPDPASAPSNGDQS